LWLAEIKLQCVLSWPWNCQPDGLWVYSCNSD